MLKAITKRRLIKLADFLEVNVKPKWFNLDVWAEPGWKEKQCDTTACAMGWATAIPSFRKAGLLLDTRGDRTSISFNDREEIDAASDFVQISNDEAYYLFAPSSYHPKNRGLKSVIKRIRNFIKREGKVDFESFVGKYS